MSSDIVKSSNEPPDSVPDSALALKGSDREHLNEYRTEEDMFESDFSFGRYGNKNSNRRKLIRVTIDTPFEEFDKSDLDSSVVELFERKVERYGNNIAVKCCNTFLTYNELNQKANQTALAILNSRENSAGNVAMLFEHGIDSIVAMLGILKAGKIIIPLDNSYPEERLKYILEDSGAGLILTNTFNFNLAKKIAGLQSRNIEIINIDEIDNNLPIENINILIKPDVISHIIYTSGSTGKPKGVVHTHKNVVHSTCNFVNSMHLSQNDRVTLFIGYAYSMSTSLIFYTLLSGAALYLNDIKLERNLQMLSNWLNEEEITVFVCVPSLYRCFMSLIPNEKAFPKIRLVLLSGESVLKKDVKLYKEHFYDSCIFGNMFGSSETMMVSCYFINKEKTLSGSTVPIGYPVEGLEILLLDEKGSEVGNSEIGEMVYRTSFLPNGYWKSTEKTERVLINDYLGGNGYLLKSGDLGRRLPDGSIEHLGRKDFQIKIRGNRIELEEIENVLDTIPGVQKSIVVSSKKENGETVLVAYFVAENNSNLEMADLKALIRQKLPEYMVPSYLIQIESIPLNSNGKVDRENLPDISSSALSCEKEFVEPRNNIEKTLADIWKNVLGIDRVSIFDNFFDIGGDSLKGMKMAAEASQNNIDITFSDLVKYKTISQITKNLNNCENTSKRVPEGDNCVTMQEERIQGTEGLEAKELPVEFQNDVTTFLHHALPLCAILADKKLIPWYYEHFTQIFAREDSKGYLNPDYLEDWGYYKFVTNNTVLGYELLSGIPNILDFVKNIINHGYYAIIHLDEFYIPDKKAYMDYHFVHQSLVYGYDNKKKIIKSIGFNKNHLFTGVDIQYDAFIKSFEEGKIHYMETARWAEAFALEIINIRAFDTEYPFDINVFLGCLNDYLTGTGKKSISYRLLLMDYVKRGETVKYGIEVQDIILAHLENLKNGKYTVDYRAIHLLAEQKKSMYKRLSYIMEKYEVPDKLKEQVSDYGKLVSKTNDIRIKFFTLTFTGDREFYKPIPDRPMLDDIIKTLEKIRVEEKVLLGSIYEGLKLIR
ncbi:MAG TPA: non-ribosomal peptide synthetase [Clostridia bacterium]